MLVNQNLIVRPKVSYVYTQDYSIPNRHDCFGYKLLTGQTLETLLTTNQKVIVNKNGVKTSVYVQDVTLDTLVFVPFLRPMTSMIKNLTLDDFEFVDNSARVNYGRQDRQAPFLNHFETPDFYDLRNWIHRNSGVNFPHLCLGFLYQLQNLAFQQGIVFEIKDANVCYRISYNHKKPLNLCFESNGVYVPVNHIWKKKSRMSSIPDLEDGILYTTAGIIREVK